MVRVCQLGVGYWGPNLLRNLNSNSRVSLQLVIEPEPGRQEYIRENYPGLRVESDSDAVFGDPEIDAVVVATPARTHYELAAQALESGKHVLVEKPMATSVAEVDQLDELAQAAERVVMVGHTFLFNDAVRTIKKSIDAGELGEIRYIYSHRLNLGRIREDVDALWNLAPHDISIIQYWLDDAQPITIERKGMDYVQHGINDVVFLTMEYPESILVNIHVSWLDPRKVRQMTIVGSQKMAVYDDMSENPVAIYDKGIDRVSELGVEMDYDAAAPGIFRYRAGEAVLPRVGTIEPLAAEIDHFVNCIVDGIPCLTGAAHARGVVDVLERASA